VLEKYDEFTNREKSLNNQIDYQKKQNKQKMSALKKKRYDLKIDRIKKQMSQFVAGPSSYN